MTFHQKEMEIKQTSFLRAQERDVQGSRSPKVPKREVLDTSNSILQNFLEGKWVFKVEGGGGGPYHDLIEGKKLFTQFLSFLSITSCLQKETYQHASLSLYLPAY